MKETNELLHELTKTVRHNFGVVEEVADKLWDDVCEMEERGFVDYDLIFQRLRDFTDIVGKARKESEIIIDHASIGISTEPLRPFEREVHQVDDSLDYRNSRASIYDDMLDDFENRARENRRGLTLDELRQGMRGSEFDTVTKVNEYGEAYEEWATSDWKDDWADYNLD